ncbi:MAG: hypothetical protein ABIG73_01080 [Patescibacteria group bacterium]
MRNKKFLAIREEIRKMMQSSQGHLSCKIGKKREEKIKESLQELKEGGIIRDFLQTNKLSFPDIVRGIDFFVIHVSGAKYKVCPLSVTGERWVKGDQDRHPNVPVVAIDLSDTSNAIKGKIMEAIGQNK